ncbi:Ig-like domain-containing protein [Pseudomonas sp. App30]|uniref:BapA/Bap/LapF family large adhesin n=1 Tax=Pseudomonas sp. App30 TaxID=3068990 RepID=UPI003A7FC269
MDNIVVADKATAQVTAQAFGNVSLQDPAVVQIPVPPQQVASVGRSGDAAVLHLKNGEQVRVDNFFKANPQGVHSDMVFQGDNGTLWQAQYSAESFNGFTFAEVSSIDDLLAGVAVVGSATPEWAIAGLGLLGAGGATAAAVGTGGGSGSGGGGGTAVDTTAPDAPTGLALSANGLLLSGLGEPGSTVTVRDSAGNVLGTGTVGSDGSFQVPLGSAQNNGQTLDVTLTDGAGNTSAPGIIVAPDTTAPAAPADLALTGDGLTLSGNGEPGSSVTVRDSAGNVLGTGTVGSDGHFQITLNQPETNGETLNVTLTDAAGNSSAPGTLVAADTTPPAVPGNLAVNADGTTLTGTGEAGSTITVKGADGTVLGTALVASDGSFSVTLAPAQTAGQALTVIDTDAAGNSSPAATAQAPDLSVPDTTPPAPATDVAISGSGSLVSGHGEAGATATVIDANGTVLGTAVVGSDGLFSISLSPAQNDGQTLQVTLTDPAGNVSPNVALTAPDLTAPAQPGNLVLSADGLTLTGTAEAGSRVLVHDNQGQVIGLTRANADGTFSLTLSSAQTNGEHLDVTATDAAGNTSTPTLLVAADTTRPDAVTDVVISADGQALSGTGEPGATVTVRDSNNAVIASGLVNANGTFEVTLQPPVTEGDTVRITQADAAGNASPAVVVVAPDADGPGTPANLQVNDDGSQLSGTGTAGNAIQVLDKNGTVIGAGVVASDGTFIVSLLPNQANGEVLSVQATDSNSEVSVSVPVTAPDITGPAAATDLAVSNNGLLLTGRGEVGATVTVKDAAGNVLGSAVVSATGSFSVTLASAQVDGQALHVTLADAAGNPSAVADINAPDLDGPLQPGNLAVNSAGTVLSGVGEAGAHITVTSTTGTVLGTAVVAADGTFSVTLSSPQHNGQTLLVSATDSTGNGAGPVSYVTPDTQAPAPVTDLAVNATGTQLTGNGEANASITVRDPSGTVIGTATVGTDGHFSVLLTTPQTNAQALLVVQADAAGNPSTPASVSAPDLTPPAQITDASISANGAVVSGHGEVGATVTVKDANGASLGSAVVGSNGLFQITLGTAQTNGQTLTVAQADAAGNPSPSSSLTAPDTQAPDAPTQLTLSSDGNTLSGVGEAGATVRVYAQDGTLLGFATVNDNGSFSVPLSGTQADGQVLHVNQTDLHNNVSADAGFTAPDTTPPGSLDNLAISPNGATVTGTGAAGDTVYVRDASGTLLGSAVVAGSGSFSVTLSPAQLDGQTLSVHQEDAATNASATQTLTAPDLTAPPAPSELLVDASGTTLTGLAQANSTVRVLDANGNLLVTVTAGSDGHFTATLPSAQLNAEVLQVTASDSSYTSLPATVTAPDTTNPAQPGNLAVTPDGSQVSGTAEAGSTVTVRDSGGTLLGSGTAGSDGAFVVTLTTPAANGSTLSVTSTDAANNTSEPGTVAGPDGTQVASPSDLALASDGSTLTGSGTAGTTINVLDSSGASLGTAVVNSSGRFSVLLRIAQVNAQTLHVTASDGTHTSVPATVVASDSTAPDAPTDVAVAANGSTLTGKGEAGASVAVTDASGAVVGTALVASNGSFVVTFTTPQLNAQALTVTQSDAAGNVSQPASTQAPDLTAPNPAANLSINNVGTVVSGTGEVGATVTVRDANGTVLGTGTVDQSGNFQVSLGSAQTNGAALHVSLTDAAGNVSADATLATVDTTPPAVVSGLAISNDGTTLNGSGEPGATVHVTDSNGNPLGTAVVASNGSFSVTLTTAQTNGQVLDVSQTDPSGNTSASVTQVAPDTTPPAALTQVAINADGVTVTGHGEPGATVQVYSADNTLLGTGLVAANGAFTLTLNTAQLNAQVLTVTQEDPPGNVSTAVDITAVDLTPPASPTDLALNGAGLQLTGHAEAGSTVTVTNAQGTVLGTITSGSDGVFHVTLNSAQTNGQALTVTATDAAGNVSSPASLTAADTTAPLAVTNLAVASDGATLAGSGEAGATVTVRDAGGTLLGTVVVGGNGSFSVGLSPSASAGSNLSVVQTDAAGNASPSASVTAPGTLAEPAPANLVLSADGLTLSGTATAGSTVSVHNAAGTLLGSALVLNDGTFSVTLASAQLNGQVLAANATSSDGINSLPASLTAADVTAPAPLSNLHLAADGAALTGRGEAGATVTVLGQGGIVLGSVVVGANGTFSLTLTTPQTNAQVLSLSQTDAAGNESNSVNLTAPDLIAPNAPTVTSVSSDGLVLSGSGEAGATVKVMGTDGTLLGTGTVRLDGTFQVTLNTPQANGQTLAVTLTDAAGNTSAATNHVSVDTTAPAALTQLAIGSDGASITGHGEAGATVTVTDANGNPLGQAVVGSTGTFTLTLSPALTNAEVLTLVQADAAGNVSPATSLTTPDFTPPADLANVAINAAGALVTGTGEAGATVTVKDAAGTVLGSTVVLADGSFAVSLSTPQVNHQQLSVQQADPPGNVSSPTLIIAPDLTPPDVPAQLQFNATGTVVTGTGEVGSTVKITLADGTVINGGAVDNTGHFLVTLTAGQAQTNGQTVWVTLTDDAGNVSATATLLAPDTTAPNPVQNLALDAAGLVLSGTGEVGASVIVTSGTGTVLGNGTVAADGTFTLTLTSAQLNGQVLSVVQQDGAGNNATATAFTALDVTAPAAPVVTSLSADGLTLTGTGEAGATLVVTSATGTTLGTTTVNADGSYSVGLNAAQLNGQVLTLVQTDGASNHGAALLYTAADVTPPAQVDNLALSNSGLVLTGTGEANAIVTVTSGGLPIGTATVAADGTFSVLLTSAQLNGQQLSVIQTDAALNPSTAQTLDARDITAPTAPLVTSLTNNGGTLNGTAEIGSVISVTNAAGTLLGTVTTGADGQYHVTLTPAQANGQVLSVVATDTAGNHSLPLTYATADITAPDAATNLSISADHSQLAGRGEVGASVAVTNAGGTSVGTGAVGANGSFVINLSPGINANDVLNVVLTDAAGNHSLDAVLTVPVNPAPDAPSDLLLAANGLTLTGVAEASSTITVYNASGTVIGTGTTTVGGLFTLTLDAAQTNGQTLSVTATTSTGGASLPATVVAADTTAPDPISDLALNVTGLIVTGRGEAGATVTVSNGSTVLGTGTVGATGTFSVTLSSAQTNGQLLSAVQADAAHNSSTAVTLTAPDTTAPAAPSVLGLNGAGLVLSGVGETGATVTVRSSAGDVLGTATVVGGVFAVTLNAAQLNGQTLNVSQADAAGNVSATATLVATDVTAPATLTDLALSSSGLQVTGKGEAGATVTVVSGATTLGTAVVNAAGTFTVTLSSAQLNGQVLSLTQADAANNVSPASTLTAADVQAPAAPTGVSLAANGLTLTGSGEIGATVTVTNAAGTALGTGTVGAGGTFTLTLNSAQLDGQVLTVRLSDAASNVSAAASLTAPDITAPAAPTGVVVNASGTLVTGTGVAGSTVKVLLGTTVLGTGTVAANGSFSVAIAAQINSQVLTVTQADPSGNVSVAATATAPDLTPPAAATGLVVSADGLTLTGSGEAGSTVTVKSASGLVLGTATVLSGGLFSVTLGSAQNHGETLTVSLTDGSGNVSTGTTVVATNIDANIPLVASNDLATATVNLAPVSSTAHYSDSFTTLLSGFSKTYSFSISAGTTGTPTLTLTAGSLVSLLNGVVYTLQVKDASGAWVTLDINGNGGLLDLLTLGSQQVQAKIGTLLAGDYRLVVSSTGIGLLTTVTSDLALQTTSLTQFTGTAGAATTGNVLTDLGTSGVADQLGPNNLAVLKVLVNGSYVTVASGAGTTVQGLYGTLVIHADGSYTYTANGSTSSVGKVDTFSYELVHPTAGTATATLYVRIDSPQATETWSSTNLASPAVVVDATNDIASTSITLAAKEVTSTSTLGTLNVPLLGGSATYTTSVASNTVSDLTVTLNASNLLSVAGGLTVTLYKMNSSGVYVVVKTVSGSSLLSLGSNNYGVTFDDQTAGTYQVKVAVTGLGILSTITTSITNAATYTNQNVVSSYTPVTGNLLTDTAGGGADVLGSAYTVLSVLLAGTYVTPGYNGTTLTGTYGSLLVHADGSYVYTLNAGLTDAVIGHTDVFTYELTHPNGTTDVATLTIDLNQAGAVATFSALALVSDDSTAATTAAVATTTEVIQGTSGNDTLDAGHGGAVTLNGGAGNDTLIVHDQNFTSVDGGTGTDTLQWAGGDATIDLGNLASRIHNIEIIDLTNTGTVSLTLNLADIIAVTETGADKLIIKGGSNDSVHMTGSTWVADASEQSGGVDYTQYTPQEDPSHHLWVQSGVHVV